MAWTSTLATLAEAREYIGNSTLSDGLMEAVGNAADATIVDYFGAHPATDPDDDADTEATKARALARRKDAFLSLCQLENVRREQWNPTFRGQRIGAENFRQRRLDILRKIGALKVW